MNDKPIYTSKTFWVNVVAIIATLTGVFGLDLNLDPDTQAAAVTAILGVVNIVLRIKTSAPIKPLGKKQ